MSGVRQTAGKPALPGETSGLEIRLLGPMEVRVGLHPLPRLRSRKGLWLLALLALRAERDVDRDFLAGMLWPEDDEPHSRRSLRQSLHDLRRALGPEAWRLSGESAHTLRLDVCASDVDALAFDAALAQGDPASLETAVQLYRGLLLEDCSEEWVVQERASREQSYLVALQLLASAAMQQGDPAAAAHWLHLAVTVDPYREDLHRALMQALAGSGDRAAALLVYRKLRELLWQEVSTEPDQETTELFRRIRDDGRKQAHRRQSPPVPTSVSSPLPSPRARPLPVPLTELIGRDEAVQEILSLLIRSRLVTLTGTGGIGKTRLAMQVASELSELEEVFEDGVCFVPLAGLSAAATVPDAVREALGMPQGDVRQETVETLKQHLFPRGMLLALDNCEHLLPACTALADTLLSHCPGLRILATSRQALGLGGERLWRVPSLALPPAGSSPSSSLSVEEVASCAAVKLFVERAQAGDSSFRMTSQNVPAIVEICRRLDGIPLALELAAARVRFLPVEEIRARLSKGFGVMAGSGPALVPRHRTLETTFDWSWDLLTLEEQYLLARLSAFSGGWSLEAVEQACADGRSDAEAFPIKKDTVLDLLSSLVDKSLVLYVLPERGTSDASAPVPEARYFLLETIRQYAAARLRASGEEHEARNRHRDYFLVWAEEVRPKLWGADQALWFHRLESEHDNLRAALEWCRAQGDLEEEFRLVVALGRFWDTYGHLREGRAHVESALVRMTPALPQALRSSALLHAGWAASTQGDYSAARDYYERALNIAREYGDQATTVRVLNMLALVFKNVGDFAAARALFEEALAICRQQGMGRVGTLLNNLGTLAMKQGDLDSARAYLEQSALDCEAAGDDPQQHGITLCNLAGVDLLQERYGEAEVHCAAALRCMSDCGAIVNLPWMLEQMAHITRAKNQPERAARLLGAAEALREAAEIPFTPEETAIRADSDAAIQEALGADAFAAALAEGRRMDRKQAIAYALQSTPSSVLDTAK